MENQFITMKIFFILLLIVILAGPTMADPANTKFGDINLG